MTAKDLSRVAVIGGGISGLATAFSLLNGNGDEDGPPLDVVVLEAGGRAGGKVRTVRLGGAAVEAGPDSFVVRKPWAVQLCDELGLTDRVVIPGASGASVLVDGELVPLPARAAFGIPGRVSDLLRWPGLSRQGAARAARDLLRPASKGDADESLGSLLRRRLGHEAATVLVEPLLAGLHAGDPEHISLLATFPELRTWERGLGSLLRGARAAVRTADEPGPGRQPMFATVWGGLSTIVEALETRIGRDRIRLDAPVARIARAGGGFALDAPGAALAPAAVVLATPAFESARLLRELSPVAAAELAAIPYASTAVVLLAYPDGTAERLPDEGTGYVVPVGPQAVTACTWLSRKWPSEEFGTRAVLRCFVGRAGREVALDLSDDDLALAVRSEIEPVLGLDVPPSETRVVRWTRSMPQYEVGHLDRVDRIERALVTTPGAFITGAAYRGIGLADCVRQARETAERVRAYLRDARASTETREEAIR
jgi:oxygen-dependent protoporphyrinogen oxidase